MKRIITCFIFLTATLIVNAQMIQYELLQTYTPADLDQLVIDFGLEEINLPAFEHNVEAYKVLYNTPYKHIDSLVQASGAVFIPRGASCPLPIANYGHGTQTKRENASSSLNGGQWEVSLMIAGAYGYMVTSPDYLGLGDADPRVKIHPYTHAFSQGHTSLNMMRSARELASILEEDLNGEIFLYGYSHGGFTTVATHRMIEEEGLTDEFHIAASAPMSGPYDLIDAQVELMISEEEYATPGYLPYIILSYKEMFPELLADISIDDVFVPPYDTLLPPLFYSGDYGIGYINGVCEPVPRDMINPQIMADFENDPNHPLRQALAESHMLDWAPQAPIKLFYCSGDEQVTYLNSELAYDSWVANGAPNVEKANLGAELDHNGCAEQAFFWGLFYFQNHRTCFGVNNNDLVRERIDVFPNPANNEIRFEGLTNQAEIRISNVTGQRILSVRLPDGVLDVSSLENGIYFFELKQQNEDKIRIGKFSIIK